MVANMNEETGIRFGIIAANSLDPEIVNELQMNGIDLHWQEALADIRKAVDNDEDVAPEDKADEYEAQVDKLGDSFYDDEPVHSFEHHGVTGLTTWLGGALLVFLFHSPFTGTFDLCGPCVPNCCNNDSPNPDGYVGYTVPEDWKYHD